MDFSFNPKLTEINLLKKLKKTILVLIETINKENKKLKDNSINDIQSLVDKKSSIANDFIQIQKSLQDFTKTNHFNNDLPILQEIKKLLDDLSVVSKENHALITGNIEASNKIMEIYKNIQKEQEKKYYSYNNQGLSNIKNKSLTKEVELISIIKSNV